MTRQYVSIQEKRLVNRFEISWDICELDDKWRCPKFALFNMVENVFSHNVSKCRSFIQAAVILKKDGDDLIITVKNTGPGIPLERDVYKRQVFPIKKDCSKLEPTIPPPKKLPIDNMSTVTIEPLMPGSVIYQILFNLPAPSILAAS